jgi:hypothetical protein
LENLCELAVYLKAGMSTGKFPDDSSAVNVHGTVPHAWVKLAMLGLNLVVWLDAVARLG